MSDKEKRCKFFNSGYCKFSDHSNGCKYVHPKETCTNKTCKQNCNKRHPKRCRYGDECKRAENCAYSHSVSLEKNKNKNIQRN